MSAKDVLIWLFARKTRAGSKYLYGDQVTRERLEGRWYSKYTVSSGAIELMVDRDGNPTNTYPHVHVIHDEAKGEVRFVLSLGPQNHPVRETLPGTASGNEVNAMIDRMVAELRNH
jgi:hypothetical protein